MPNGDKQRIHTGDGRSTPNVSETSYGRLSEKTKTDRVIRLEQEKKLESGIKPLRDAFRTALSDIMSSGRITGKGKTAIETFTNYIYENGRKAEELCKAVEETFYAREISELQRNKQYEIFQKFLEMYGKLGNFEVKALESLDRKLSEKGTVEDDKVVKEHKSNIFRRYRDAKNATTEEQNFFNNELREWQVVESSMELLHDARKLYAEDKKSVQDFQESYSRDVSLIQMAVTNKPELREKWNGLQPMLARNMDIVTTVSATLRTNTEKFLEELKSSLLSNDRIDKDSRVATMISEFVTNREDTSKNGAEAIDAIEKAVKTFKNEYLKSR